MKRAGNLKSIWCNYETLMKAFCEVKKRKSYKDVLLNYESNLAINLNNLLGRLDGGTYEPQKPYEFKIYEPKERIIQAPHLEDRIVQHALLIAARKHIEKKFLSCSYACRKHYGTHKASNDLKSALTKYRGEGFYLKLDIKKYFYTLSHSVVLRLLKRAVKCKPTIELFKKFFIKNQSIGLALGNVTSQILANLYLNPIDHFVKRVLKVKDYFRYMDDLILISKSKKWLLTCWHLIQRGIRELELTLNGKCRIGAVSEGVDFVGYRTWFNKRIIRKSSLFRIKRKLKKDASMARVASFLSHSKGTNSLQYVANKILEIVPEYKDFIKEWITNNKHGECNAIFQG